MGVRRLRRIPFLVHSIRGIQVDFCNASGDAVWLCIGTVREHDDRQLVVKVTREFGAKS